ncbi:MAG: hypothetical protein MJK18_11140, partial [Bdellovibrionales bacterium]|nr:hypothetical protein [Bdellovibrionales bacterium]
MPKVLDNLTNREQKVLHFLWTWKIVSSATLFYRFFPNIKAKSAYVKLNRLRHKKYIKRINLPLVENGSAWT